MVYQYKNGVKDLIFELPAGFIEENETTIESGKRELIEETGFSVENLRELGIFVPNPSISGNKNFVLLGTNAERVTKQKLDTNEKIEVQLFDFEELVMEIKKRKSRLVGSQDQLGLLLAWEEINK